MSGLTVHTADAVVPLTGPPIVSGAVAVDDGVIVAVGARDDILRLHSVGDVVDWDGVLLPGLVNAHTHLQYSSFAEIGAETYRDFVSWSERFVVEYEARRDEDWSATARFGLEKALTTGTTCLADIATDVAALGVLGAMDVPGVSYLELIGIDLAAWESGVEATVVETLADAARGGSASIGVSPHAPYSLDEPVLRAAAALARSLGLRIHLHLAESDGEDAFYRSGTGALADRVTMRVGRPWSILAAGGSGQGAAEFAMSCGLLGEDSHVAHGVYLGADGRRLLRDAGTVIALCPRSNLTIGLDPPPITAFLEEDSPIAVGTDSLGSSPSLDLLADVALLRRLAIETGYRDEDLDRRLLHAATIGGARAMGLQSRLGSLGIGKRADLAVFAVDPDPAHVERAIVEGGAGHCIGTIVAGSIRWRAW